LVVALDYVQNQSSSCLLAAALALFGTNLTAAPSALPSVKVLVADSAGKVAFKGVTDASGAFSTGSLAGGNYVVQFNSTSAATANHSYILVVSAGKKKVAAESIDGGKLTAGGVAMKIAVAAGSKISGQVAASNVKIDDKTKKMMVYIPPRIGSNMPGHWVPADSAEAIAARNSGELRTEDIRRLQDHDDLRSSSVTGN
jgi:hypothetical protein